MMKFLEYMMRFGKGMTRMSALIAPGMLLAMPVAANQSELAMLDTLDRGGWDFRIRSNNTQQRICVRDGREFIQLRHRQPRCEQFVVKDTANEVTVQYTCRGNGYGRTTIRRESSDLVQIRSQGIFNGIPFLLDGEARKTGAC